MAHSNPTYHHKGAFRQGWNDALKAKRGTRNRYRNLGKDNWMVIGFRFNDELGWDDEQVFQDAWNWSVKEYQINGTADPKKFLQEFEDESLRQANEIETYVRTGTGFADTETKRDVERAAILFVTNWYEGRDWLVESVENEKIGYDLNCSKGSMVQCVEVKGIGGEDVAFIITQREFREAQTNSDFVICIITSALSIEPKLHPYSGSQFIEKFKFDPIAYRATLK